MGYFDEIKKGAANAEEVTGESFALDGTTGFKGYFGDEDPEVTFMLTGKKVKRALVMDATKGQFTRKGVTPTSGKVLVYDGSNYVVRQVFAISGDMWRFKIYLP